MQKPMGRPPKKRTRTDDEDLDISVQPGNDFWPTPEDTPPGSFRTVADPAAASDAQHLCPQLFWLATEQSPSSQHITDLLVGDENHNSTWRPDRPQNPNLPVPRSSSPWPDFSTVSEASAMPFPLPASLQDLSHFQLTPSSLGSSNSPSPQCTCLSYLYLCLSHISSIASFPISSHTICSLYIAAKTAQEVIRCEACPKNFATGVQNVMFTGTLLTVVADAWLRVYNSDPAGLAMQAAPPEFVSRALQYPSPEQAWKCWLRQIVRRAVIGGPFGKEAEIPYSNQPDLLSLINEVENRQRRWHEPGQHPFPENNPFEPGHDHDTAQSCSEKEHLCLRVVGSARSVLAKFKFEPHEFTDGVVPDDLK